MAAQTQDQRDLAHDLRVACIRLARRVRYNTATLSPTFFSVLAKLECGPTTAAELAQIERVSAPSMSRTVSELAERGYLHREQDPADKRRILLSLTDVGRAALDQARAERNLWMTQRITECTPSELASLREATDIINRILEG